MSKKRNTAAAPRQQWHQVRVPKPWNAEPGDELIGTFLCSREKKGRFGDYTVHYIQTRTQVYYVSGTLTNDLFALLSEGQSIKLVFEGKQDCANSDHSYKVYKLYTEEAVVFKIVPTVEVA